MAVQLIGHFFCRLKFTHFSKYSGIGLLLTCFALRRESAFFFIDLFQILYFVKTFAMAIS